MIISIKLRSICLILAISLMVAFSLYTTVNPMVFAKNDLSQSFPIIMYHHVTTDKNRVGEFAVMLDSLEKDFSVLKSRGYRTITIRELYAINAKEMQLPPKTVMLTFDDGFKSFYEYVFPLLKKYGFTAVLSFVGKYTDDASAQANRNYEYAYLSWDEINIMLNSCLIEIASHSYDLHKSDSFFKGVDMAKNESISEYTARLREDIRAFNRSAVENLDYTPWAYAYPYGAFSCHTEEILKSEGYFCAFTCREERVVPLNNENWLFSLGRYNRDGRISSEKFLNTLLLR